MSRIIAVQIDPTSITSDSARSESFLKPDASNFASWYRHIADDQGLAIKITEALREVLDGFSHFQFVEAGEKHRVLKAHFTRGAFGPIILPCSLSDLSDGQRALIVVYALLTYALDSDVTLCVDEPDNFVALPEIQPWLTEVFDACSEGRLQALLISHHPEAIDYLAHSNGYWFFRDMFTPARCRRVSEEKDGLSISELVARGWLDD